MYVLVRSENGCNLINTDSDIYNAEIKPLTNLRYPETHVLSKNLFTLKSVTINKQTHTGLP
jgi:hypothetical protein